MAARKRGNVLPPPQCGKIRKGDNMPLTKKGKKIMTNMKQEYGSKKGESVFYASANKGTIKGVHGKKK
jgi:hypothetical protein